MGVKQRVIPLAHYEPRLNTRPSLSMTLEGSTPKKPGTTCTFPVRVLSCMVHLFSFLVLQSPDLLLLQLYTAYRNNLPISTANIFAVFRFRKTSGKEMLLAYPELLS